MDRPKDSANANRENQRETAWKTKKNPELNEKKRNKKREQKSSKKFFKIKKERRGSSF